MTNVKDIHTLRGFFPNDNSIIQRFKLRSFGGAYSTIQLLNKLINKTAALILMSVKNTGNYTIYTAAIKRGVLPLPVNQITSNLYLLYITREYKL